MVTELESAIHERKKNTEDEVDGTTEEIVSGDDDGLEEKALEVAFESVLAGPRQAKMCLRGFATN